VTDLTSAGVDMKALLTSSTFKDLLVQMDAVTADAEPRSTIASRKEALAEALSADLDGEKLIELQETLSNYVDLLARAEVEFDGSGAELTPVQLAHLMRRDQDTRKIKELVEVVADGVKRIVFEAITAKVARENPDEPFPEYVNDDIEVPELGKRFCRERAGRKVPLIDQEKLRSALGEEKWAQVTETVHVPAHTETNLSEQKLMALATLDPSVLQTIESSLIPAGWNVGAYTVRDLKSRKK